MCLTMRQKKFGWKFFGNLSDRRWSAGAEGGGVVGVRALREGASAERAHGPACGRWVTCFLVEIEMGSWQVHRRASSCVACYNNCCKLVRSNAREVLVLGKKEKKRKSPEYTACTNFYTVSSKETFYGVFSIWMGSPLIVREMIAALPRTGHMPICGPVGCFQCTWPPFCVCYEFWDLLYVLLICSFYSTSLSDIGNLYK